MSAGRKLKQIIRDLQDKIYLEDLEGVLLGHSEIETTLRYAHVSNEKVKNDFKKYSK